MARNGINITYDNNKGSNFILSVQFILQGIQAKAIQVTKKAQVTLHPYRRGKVQGRENDQMAVFITSVWRDV